jgi:hypothetical protein
MKLQYKHTSISIARQQCVVSTVHMDGVDDALTMITPSGYLRQLCPKEAKVLCFNYDSM